MAVEDFGAAAKGMRVEIVFADHQNKRDVGTAIARRWYDEQVDVIVDVPTSPVTLAISQIARERGKALLISSAGSANLTGNACTPNTIHWTYDNWALAHSTAKALVKSGAKTWFFVTVDDDFGRNLEREVEGVVRENGGTVLDKIRHPLSTADFSSFLLQAQASRARIIGLANTGTDATNAIEQGTRLGLVQRGQHFASLLMFITDVHRLGLNKSQGLMLAESFYWDLNDQTRAWSIRFARRHWGAMPTMAQAGVYSAVLHYLKDLDALKGDDGTRVIAKMKALPADDPLFGRGTIRGPAAPARRPVACSCKLKTLWRDRTLHFLFEPIEFLEKLAALIPRPAVNLLFYHGVLAPRARWRSRVIGYGRPTPDRPAVALEPRPRGNIPTPAWTWAALMRRVFALDVLVCPRCAGRLRVIATVHDPAVVRAILAHLGLAPGPDSPGPAPPPPEHPAATA